MTSGISSDMLSVLHPLTRQRSVVISAGTELGTVLSSTGLIGTVLSRLAFLEQHVLIELTVQGPPPGYLLIQRGEVVFAQSGTLTGQAAVTDLEVTAGDQALKLFALGNAAAALAFAAVQDARTNLHHGSQENRSIADYSIPDGAVRPRGGSLPRPAHADGRES
ncbi:hypothetical protein [Deinococcus sp.]|uniref:hypothetical protein n=1 Tax=Deinococcus sp. TaxID=47478 RepID=UPI003C7ADEEA